jgi:hypothetical protein
MGQPMIALIGLITEENNPKSILGHSGVEGKFANIAINPYILTIT